MNKRAMVAIALTSAATMIGCVSLESTREQLASSNPQEVQKAEQNIYIIATTGMDGTQFKHFTVEQQIEYVNLASSNELLLKIIDDSRNEKVYEAAAKRVDFSKPGIGMTILTEHSGALSKVGSVGVVQSGSPSKIAGRTRSARGNQTKESAKSAEPTCFFDKVFASLNEDELRKALGMDKIDSDYKKKIARRLVDVTQDAQLLIALYDGDLSGFVEYNGGREAAIIKLASMPDKLSDSELLVKILTAKERGREARVVKDASCRKKLIARLDNDAAVKYGTEVVKGYGSLECGKFGTLPFEDAIAAMNVVTDTKSAVRIAAAVIAQIDSIGDDEEILSFVKRFPAFSDKAINVLVVTAKGTNWKYLLDRVSADVAYEILSKGGAKSADLELELVKKLPKKRVDMVIYNGARFDNTKKAIMEVMSPEMKKSAAEATEKAFEAICEKAKAASKETFELEGFYLGMSFDDLKIVFAHHFPDIETREGTEELALYVAGQTAPFCYANAKDKKVYQINFGKKLLKKWYQYDVQTPMEWAHKYARETKIDMNFVLIEKDTTVYERDMSRSYRVWFHQVSYQYKHNTKEYRLTFFGEERDFTVEGGLGGEVIKGLAAKDFRYVRGDEWSLRANIERD